MKALRFSFLILCLMFPGNTWAQVTETLPSEEDEIYEMDLRQLMKEDVVVTSVSKKPELLHKAASAIYVISQEDIRRSGAVNIMEALRMVPGVLVSKINQNRYAISIRGFNRRQGSDKLLVLMDGRSIYSPVASGVFWIGQDTVLEDIDRIEVIRGPGAALWGSNAVAGVINIITKSSHETQKGFLAGGAGTEERGFATVRYGGKIKDNASYRVYGKYRNRDRGKNTNGMDSFDDKQIGQGGFRTDWNLNKQDKLTVQGDYYRLNSELDFPRRFVSIPVGSLPFLGTNIQEGYNLLSRWTHQMADHSSYQFQVYFDRLTRKSGVPFDNVIDQFDLDFQHNFMLGKNHNVSWGLNYRFANFNLKATAITHIDRQTTHLGSFFIHDEITLIPKTWNVILGAKVEYNVFTGTEIQPSVRSSWTPNDNHTFWAAFSRAVRIPNISEEEITANRAVFPPIPPSTVPILLKESNDGRTDAEVLLAYELGYRFKAKKTLVFDFTAFYFDYDNLIELNRGSSAPATNPIPHTVSTFSNDNSFKGYVLGAEISGQWQPFRFWKLAGSYSYAHINLERLTNAVFNASTFNSEGDVQAEGEPDHIFNIRSYLNLPHNLEFDTLFYFVNRNKSRNIPSYGRLDLRLGWRPATDFELSLSAQNILDSRHPELNELLETASETQRSYYLKFKWGF